MTITVGLSAENALTSKDNSNNMKKCSKCKIEKDLTEFSKDRTKKDGYLSSCKSCYKEYNKKYYKKNKEKILLRTKKYREANKEYYKKYREANKEYHKEYRKEYREANKEKILLRSKKYRQANKEKIKKYREANKEKINKYQIKYNRKKRKTDHLFKMKKNLRNRTYQAFKNKGYSKTSKTQEMLGVDWEVVKQHIEEQFTEGMNWDNQGEWHIDHIIPLASANNEAELKKLCHYSNLQPLWAEDNIKKSDKIFN